MVRRENGAFSENNNENLIVQYLSFIVLAFDPKII